MYNVINDHKGTVGLFSHMLGWLIQILPFVDKECCKQKINPNFILNCPTYGEYPTYSIIPSLITVNNIPSKTKNTRFFVKKMYIQFIEPNNNIYDKRLYCFKNNFQLANKLFFKYFSINKQIVDEVTNLTKNFTKPILGLHFRGTDKNVPNCFGVKRNYSSLNLFVEVIKESVKKYNIKTLFIATDDLTVIEVLKNLNLEVNIQYRDIERSTKCKKGFHIQRTQLLLNAIKTGSDQVQSISKLNNKLGKDAMIDALSLSKCDVVIKNQSQLSAWAKIFNPNIKIYRLDSLTKYYWPDSHIPLYKSDDPNLQKQLNNCQNVEISDELKESVSSFDEL